MIVHIVIIMVIWIAITMTSVIISIVIVVMLLVSLFVFVGGVLFVVGTFAVAVGILAFFVALGCRVASGSVISIIRTSTFRNKRRMGRVRFRGLIIEKTVGFGKFRINFEAERIVFNGFAIISNALFKIVR